MTQPDIENKAAPKSPARRDFMKKTGRFAVVTTPTVALLLSTSLTSGAVAKSGGGVGRGGSRFGSGGSGNFIRNLLDWLRGL